MTIHSDFFLTKPPFSTLQDGDKLVLPPRFAGRLNAEMHVQVCGTALVSCQCTLGVLTKGVETGKT